MTVRFDYRCSCGKRHWPGDAVGRMIAKLGEHVRVATNDGSWRVPRIFIAEHGPLDADDVPALAARYGWEPSEEVPPAGKVLMFERQRVGDLIQHQEITHRPRGPAAE